MTDTQTPARTGIQQAAHDAACALLNAASEREGKPILDGDDGAQVVVPWIEQVEARIVELLSSPLTMPLPEPLPLAQRQRFTMADLFGGIIGSNLDHDELVDAMREADEAKEQAPFDEDEDHIVEELRRAIDATQYEQGTSFVQEGYIEGFLQDQVPHGLPDWLNDRIEWDAIVREAERDTETFELDGSVYHIMSGYDER